MDLTKKLEELEEKRKEIKRKREDIESTWEMIELEDEQLESQDLALKAEVRKLREDHFEEGFQQWKQETLNNGKEVNPYSFVLTEEETLKVRYIEDVYGGSSGAVGGGTEYSITPTTIGDIIFVKVKGNNFIIRDL